MFLRAPSIYQAYPQPGSLIGWLARPSRLSCSRVGSKWEGETIAIANDNASVIRDYIMSLERPQMVSQQRDPRVHEPARSS